MVFLTEEKPLSPKPFCDLSLFTVLALEQVSVINNFKDSKKGKSAKKQ